MLGGYGGVRRRRVDEARRRGGARSDSGSSGESVSEVQYLVSADGRWSGKSRCWLIKEKWCLRVFATPGTVSFYQADSVRGAE